MILIEKVREVTLSCHYDKEGLGSEEKWIIFGSGNVTTPQDMQSMLSRLDSFDVDLTLLSMFVLLAILILVRPPVVGSKYPKSHVLHKPSLSIQVGCRRFMTGIFYSRPGWFSWAVWVEEDPV